jgi:hypothetical protein
LPKRGDRQAGVDWQVPHKPHDDLTQPVVANAVAVIARAGGVLYVLDDRRVAGCQQGLSQVGVLFELGKHRLVHISEPTRENAAKGVRNQNGKIGS